MQTATQLEPISVDIPEACRLTSVGKSKLYQLMDAGEVRSVKVGKRRLVLIASLRDWLAKLETGTDQAG